ncbi:MAG TPA: hypothetical protein VF824_10645 [Thermoanaerobaculia bacterium]
MCEFAIVDSKRELWVEVLEPEEEVVQVLCFLVLAQLSLHVVDVARFTMRFLVKEFDSGTEELFDVVGVVKVEGREVVTHRVLLAKLADSCSIDALHELWRESGVHKLAGEVHVQLCSNDSMICEPFCGGGVERCLECGDAAELLVNGAREVEAFCIERRELFYLGVAHCGESCLEVLD